VRLTTTTTLPTNSVQTSPNTTHSLSLPHFLTSTLSRLSCTSWPHPFIFPHSSRTRTLHFTLHTLLFTPLKPPIRSTLPSPPTYPFVHNPFYLPIRLSCCCTAIPFPLHSHELPTLSTLITARPLNNASRGNRTTFQ
jgi:hypothetical protein